MKRCPICDELIEEHLQVCPYCDEDTGFEPETISKKVCPVCGELIDEVLMVCPVCGEDITPQTNSEHAPISVGEEPKPVKGSEQESEVAPKPVIEPQPEPAQPLEPIVEEPEFVQEPEIEPETKITSKKECPVCGELMAQSEKPVVFTRIVSLA